VHEFELQIIKLQASDKVIKRTESISHLKSVIFPLAVLVHFDLTQS